MKKKISLVLSGGGARGMAHIGVIHELERRGYEITSLAGTSIGSMIAGAYAAGKLTQLEQFLTGLTEEDVVRYMDLTLSGNGLLKGMRVFDRMKEFWPDCRMEDLPIPLSIVATDLVSGRECVFKKGSLYQAMRASISIPVLFTPQSKHGRMLVDGGLSELLPFDQIERTRGSLLAAVNLYGPSDPNLHIRSNSSRKQKRGDKQGIWHRLSHRLEEVKDWKVLLYRSLLSKEGDHQGYLSTLRQATAIMMQCMARQSIRLHKPDLLIEVPNNCAGALDFHYSRELIRLGTRLAQEALDDYERRNDGWKGFLSHTARLLKREA